MFSRSTEIIHFLTTTRPLKIIVQWEERPADIFVFKLFEARAVNTRSVHLHDVVRDFTEITAIMYR